MTVDVRGAIVRALLGIVLLCLSLAGGSARAAGVSREAFLTGADLSELPYRESQGFHYYDAGVQRDLLDIAKRSGWKVIRVRLWVHPDPKPESDVSSLTNVTAFGRRIKSAGLLFLLDIHYSDTWADPGNQKKPAAWDALPFLQLVRQVHDYSRDVITHLRQNGAMPDLVQIGNETRNGLLYGSGTGGTGPQPGGGFWEKTPGGRDRAVQLFAAGLAGVREGASPAPAPRTILHVPDGQDTGFVRDYFRDLESSAKAQHIALDYDVVGLSYYPAHPWDQKAGYDGWAMERLAASLNYVAGILHKPVMVVETNWPRAGGPDKVPGTPQFPFTPAGQVQYYQALLRTVRAVPGGLGRGVVPWDQDARSWDSVFDDRGNALPAVRVLGGGDR